MAQRHLESFNTHLGSTEMGRRYDSASGSSGITTSDQVTMQKGSIGLKHGTLVLITKALVGSPTNTWFSGVRFKMAANLAGSPTLGCGVAFLSGAGTQIYWVAAKVDTYTYKIEIRRGGSGALIDSTGPYFWDKEHVIEFKAVVHPSTGAYELVVDGDLILGAGSTNTAGQGTPGADVAALLFTSSNQVIFSDWYVVDDVAVGLNDYAGPDYFLIGGSATADGDRLEWTPSTAGAHFSKVNESPGNSNDSTYVAGELPGDVDLYVYDPANFSILGAGASILGVCLTSTAGMQASGSGDMVGHYKDPGASEASFGATATIDSTTQRCAEHHAHENPATSVPWVSDDIHDGQFGPERA